MENKNNYVPSKFNALSKTDDGGVILYNSYTGAIVDFSEEEKAEVMGSLKRTGAAALDSDVKKALFDNGFIVPGNVDEMKRAEYLHQSMHRTDMLHLILMTTEQCNFRCTYCYETFARGKMTDDTKSGVKALVKEQANTLNNLHISWFGGEPLLELGIIEELSNSFMAEAKENKIDYSADIVTNGFFLTREVLEKLLSWEVRQYMVTIDGVQAVHDSRRHMAGGQGTFERIIENLKAVKESTGQFDMTIRVNFDEDNLEETGELIEFLKEHFADDKRFGVFFRPVGRWGGEHNDEIPTCTHITANKKIWEFTETAMDKGISMSNMVTGSMMPTASVCYAAKPNAMVIGSDGQLYKCTTVLDEEVNKVGHINADGTMDLDYDKIASWVMSGEETDSVCQSCFYRPACQGNHCPWYRVVSGERPCPSEKKNIKKVLNLVWRNSLQKEEV
ncbi:radical SAM protein [Rummeliibacillus pycnus]|uniref:radical SAM protein n=1 Tax=Rummeliibacillus pycnus TaxID=101070 RepID=UPI0037C56DB2